MKRCESGFTLVELVMVIAIIATSSMVIVPSAIQARNEAELHKFRGEIHDITPLASHSEIVVEVNDILGNPVFNGYPVSIPPSTAFQPVHYMELTAGTENVPTKLSVEYEEGKAMFKSDVGWNGSFFYEGNTGSFTGESSIGVPVWGNSYTQDGVVPIFNMQSTGVLEDFAESPTGLNLAGVGNLTTDSREILSVVFGGENVEIPTVRLPNSRGAFFSGGIWVDEWAVGSNYSLGDLINYNGVTYYCMMDGVSSSSDTPDTTTWMWNPASNSILWKEYAMYAVDDIRMYDGTLFMCIKSHTASSMDMIPTNATEYWRFIGVPSSNQSICGNPCVHCVDSKVCANHTCSCVRDCTCGCTTIAKPGVPTYGYVTRNPVELTVVDTEDYELSMLSNSEKYRVFRVTGMMSKDDFVKYLMLPTHSLSRTGQLDESVAVNIYESISQSIHIGDILVIPTRDSYIVRDVATKYGCYK